MRQWILFLWLATPGLSADVLPSDSFAPAILFNSAIVLDGSYNESLLAGMEQFEQRKGVPFTRMATADPILYRQSLESLAMAGHSPIIVPGGWHSVNCRGHSAIIPRNYLYFDWLSDGCAERTVNPFQGVGRCLSCRSSGCLP